MIFFSLLFRDMEKKDKEDLDDRDKEKLKKHTVNRTWANWLAGHFIYMGVVARAQPYKAADLIQYGNIIYKAYTKCSGSAWKQYDEEFRQMATLNLYAGGLPI